MKLHDKGYCPILPKDIDYWILFENKNGNSYCFGSVSIDKYIQLNEENYDAVIKASKQMDGKHTISQIQEILEEEHHLKLDMEELCVWFGKAGLLLNAPEEIKIEKQEMDYLSITIKSFSLKNFETFFHFLGVKHRNSSIFISALVIISGLSIGFRDIQQFFHLNSYEINNSLIVGLISMLLMFVVSIGIHEFSHAITGYACGLKPKEVVFSLYLGTPMFYVKMPGIYTISPKKELLCGYLEYIQI